MTLEEKIKIITVRWDETTNQYKVSEPNWKGGEVVLLSELRPVMEEMKEALDMWNGGYYPGIACREKAKIALSKYNELFKNEN